MKVLLELDPYTNITCSELKNTSRNNHEVGSFMQSSFLDSCVIYLSDDFEPSLSQNLRKKIRISGGTLANIIDGFVTHCIVSKPSLSQRYVTHEFICVEI